MGKSREQDIASIALLLRPDFEPGWEAIKAAKAVFDADPLRYRAVTLRESNWRRRMTDEGFSAVLGYPGWDDSAWATERGLRTVSLLSSVPKATAYVVPDQRAMGRLAAEHLIECGHRRLAYVWFRKQKVLSDRGAGFVEAAREAGVDVQSVVLTGHELPPELIGPDRPTAAFAADDRCGSLLIEVAQRAGLAVPDHLAVVAANNETHTCEFADVPMSSIDINPVQIGQTAAAVLIRLINDEAPPDAPVLVTPLRVVTRRSSDAVAPGDEALSHTLSYIQMHACRGVQIEDLMEGLTISRRTLERRFRQRFGRSLLDEVRRVQMQRASELLLDTQLPIGEIAHRCGISEHSRFTSYFTKRFGVTPTRFRYNRSIAHTPRIDDSPII